MYVDAVEDRDKDKVLVAERRNGKRILIEYPMDYTFYVKDPTGKYESIYGDKLSSIVPKSFKEHKKLVNANGHRKTFESQVSFIFRCLEKNYLGQPVPDLNIAFFDIETDFDPDFGYCEASEATNPITSIAIHLQWLDQLVCLAVPPPTITWEEAEEIAEKVGETILCKSEAEMLQIFLTLIEDADVLSGWNSELYDIPFTINRISKVLGKHEIKKMCLWGKEPRRRYISFGGKESQTYDLFGRVSSDYLALYKKYTYEERQSYSLDSIAEVELGKRKVPYDGTLDDLYKYDFQKFLEYNIQDTRLLNDLDQKLKYIDLCASIAHDSAVLMPTAMGTVSMVEQAITIEAHSRGMIVPDTGNTNRYGKEQNTETTKDRKYRAAGGWVSYPKKGLHKWVGSADLNSLYPSVIRAFNMSPETLYGQISYEGTEDAIDQFMENGTSKNTFAAWWQDKFNIIEMEPFYKNSVDEKVTLDLVDGSKHVLSGAELRQLVFDSGLNIAITACGTLFRMDKEGVIPSLLTRWYTERKRLQGIMRQFEVINSEERNYNGPPLDELELDNSITKKDVYDFRDEMLYDALKSGDFDVIVNFMKEWGLCVKNGKVVPQPKWKKAWKSAQEFWDKQQLVKKILLNSAYGGLLNINMKFFDKRIGQSTTLTGRSITKHMTAKTNELICGVYDHDGDCIIYNDTDSCVGSTLISTTNGNISIEKLFYESVLVFEDKRKQFSKNNEVQVLSYDGENEFYGNIEYIYRHKVDKPLYEIEDEDGNVVTVTEDHSLMVERDGELIECTPNEILENDVLITYVPTDQKKYT